MTEELVGYVSGNRKREQIIQALSNTPLEAAKIARISRIPERLVGRILDDLKKKGLVKVDEKVYSLTEAGVEVENKIRSLR
ncbi:MAG: winged helix-turn-helix domain-containing protein [Methanocellales archaeon]|nr:winged helix-turn-helix domain-containing protein [Methanocellales archaeon]